MGHRALKRPRTSLLDAAWKIILRNSYYIKGVYDDGNIGGCQFQHGWIDQDNRQLFLNLTFLHLSSILILQRYKFGHSPCKNDEEAKRGGGFVFRLCEIG